jgi:hypothetical protein
MNEQNKSMSEQNARQWKTEDLQKALQPNFRFPVAAASRQYNILCRTYKIPERKLGRLQKKYLREGQSACSRWDLV